ncbi:MAG: hypothetical protein ACOYKE_02455 [Ferruginibacter sp.]
MKNFILLVTLFLTTALLSTGIVAAFNTEPLVTTLCVSTVETGFYLLTSMGYVTIPFMAIGEYIGAPGASTGSGSAGVQVINTERARGAVMAYKTNPKYAGKNITQSYLRLETVISNNNNKLVFKTYVGDGTTQAPAERRLDRNDMFVITEIGLLLVKQGIGKSNGRLVAYPNAILFGAAAPDLESIYNGELSIQINNTKFVVALDTQRFLKVPETQQSGNGNRDQSNLKSILSPLTPHIELDGSGKNELEIVYPSHAAWAGGTADEGFEHRAVLYCHGLLISGGSANE